LAEPPRGPRALDRRLLLLARTRGHSPHVERAVAGFSRIGEHGAVWLALGSAGALLDSAPRRGAWRHAVVAVAGTYLANTALKLVVRRRRPELPGLPALTDTPTRLSFPSAHAATSFAAARLYARIGVPVFPLYELACALALSRLYLGVHYPSDVIAGALLGSAIAAAVPLAVQAPARADSSRGPAPLVARAEPAGVAR
jgi:membrane-associated phospholipid phosphatase